MLLKSTHNHPDTFILKRPSLRSFLFAAVCKSHCASVSISGIQNMNDALAIKHVKLRTPFQWKNVSVSMKLHVKPCLNHSFRTNP